MSSLGELPKHLPVPIDDGACDHLVGMSLPNLEFQTTDDQKINFAMISGRVVIYLYPMTGRPDVDLPDGWNDIPGARGCTPQSCAFRDHYQEIKKLNAQVFGLSTQSTEYQLEVVGRLHLPYPLVSDERLDFINALSIPTFTVGGVVLSKRLTVIAKEGVIEKVFYPVFPPDKNANDVVVYLNQKKTI